MVDLSGFKTYAEWQAANRAAGGPGESAEVRAQFLANGGNAPAQAAPAQPVHNVYSAQGPQEITEQNRQTADMTPQQRAAWAAQNINSFDAQSRQGAGGPGASTQQALDQWLAWDDKYDASCPPNRPYRGRTGTCEESPDNCPEGTTLHGSQCISHEQANNLFGGGYGPNGGAQGQAGAGAPSAPGQPASSGDPLQDALVRQYGERGGAFAGSPSGQSLTSGGIWWAGSGGALPMPPQAQTQAVQSTAATQAATQAAQPNQPSQPSQPTNSAFSGGGFTGGSSVLANSLASAGVQPTQPQTNPIAASLARKKQEDPNAWWQESASNMKEI